MHGILRWKSSCLALVATDALAATEAFAAGDSSRITGERSARDICARFAEACLARFYQEVFGDESRPQLSTDLRAAASEANALQLKVHAVHRFLRLIHRQALRRLSLAGEAEGFSPGWQSTHFDRAVDAWELLVQFLEPLFAERLPQPGDESYGPVLARLIDELLASRGRDKRVVAGLAKHLGATLNGRWVIAAGSSSSYDDFLREAAQLRLFGVATHCFTIDSWAIWFGQLPESAASLPPDWLRTVKCSYLIGESLADVPECVELSQVLYAGLPSTANGPWSVRDGWIQLVLWSITDHLKYLTRNVFSNISTEMDDELFSQLIMTALTYLKTGSVTDTSRLLYIHRNTVLYRLNRLKALTAIDWSKPFDAALLVILLNAISSTSKIDYR